MDFKFEPGNYYLAGRDTLDGHDVLKIDYYPTKLFDDDDDEDAERPGAKRPAKKRQGRAGRRRTSSAR